jgi:hypothetical protein
MTEQIPSYTYFTFSENEKPRSGAAGLSGIPQRKSFG